jgi:hypothetical protein
MIGAEGFEPPTYCSQSSRASQAALCSDDILKVRKKTIPYQSLKLKEKTAQHCFFFCLRLNKHVFENLLHPYCISSSLRKKIWRDTLAFSIYWFR